MDGPQTRALAEHLNEVLAGRPVDKIIVPEHRWQANVLLLNCVGQVVQRVRSHGKWLFFDFSHGVTWLCELVTRAKWTVREEGGNGQAESEAEAAAGAAGGAAPATAARREPLITVYLRGNRARLGTMATRRGPTRVVATLTGRPIFYILTSDKVRQHPDIKMLGPDPLASAAFYDEFPYRLRQNPGRTVAATLLDQQVVAGIGNALKCEILYAMRFAPSLRVGALLASQVDHLSGTIVGLAATATTFAFKGERFPYRAYDRAGLACGICGSEIAVDRSGADAHLTWYCPTCQPVGKEPLLFDGGAG